MPCRKLKGTAIEKAREPNVISNLTGKVAGLSIKNKTTLFENPEFKLTRRQYAGCD